ncbi:MAG: hypothetical protein H0X66_06865 [Verrucomicrobia bacterium]|nr:hypothetical protein [Verrucomicrobiota bacterium]
MRFHFLRYLSLLLFLFVTAASAQTAERRVLFIVETSKETKSLAEAERKLVGALVDTGLGGLLEANDSFGVWTFNETLHVGKFPMQRWTPDGRKLLVQRVHDFLKAQPYEKSPRIETVWRPLQTVIRNSPAIMVVLVTSGKHAISGTPFDDEINSHLKSAYRDYQKKKTPAVVVLSATSGEILRYSVNPAIGDVRIPILTVPIVPVKIAQPAPTPKTNAPPSKPKVAAPAPKADTDAAFVITKEGLKNVSRLEADRISTDNFERNPVPEIEQLSQIPPVPQNKGPIILKHEVEVITHTIAIEPPSAKLNADIQVPQEKTTRTDVISPIAVSAPKPAVTQALEPVQPTPAVAHVEPQLNLVPEAPKPIPSEKPVPPVAAAPVELAQKVEPITPIAPKPAFVAPVAPAPADAPSTFTERAEPVSAPPPVSIPTEATESVAFAGMIEPHPLVAQTSPQPARSPAFLMGAAALILVAIFLAFLVGRQTGKRPQQSLVSDWAERDRAKK